MYKTFIETFEFKIFVNICPVLEFLMLTFTYMLTYMYVIYRKLIQIFWEIILKDPGLVCPYCGARLLLFASCFSVEKS